MYRFSPSILDKFQRYLESNQEFESDFNYSEETGYKSSLEEIVAAREQELLDALNRVPQPSSIAAARGTAFNEAVDMAVACRSTSGTPNVECITFGAVYEMECEGHIFKFDGQLVAEVAALVNDGTMQMHIQSPINTEHGDVLLHGYPDYIQPTQITDLKTTESYIWGKYGNYWQRYAYPYILQKTGLMERVNIFEFLVVEMKEDRKTGIISGSVYKEDYSDVNLEKCETELRWILGGLILFVEEHRDQITNPKIFI